MTSKPSTGTLGQTPLCQLLIFLLDRSLSGSLVVQHTIGGKSAITVEHGVPVKVRAGNTQYGFGQICVALGLTSEERLEDFLEAEKDGRPIGEAMTARGLIPASAVTQVLEEQVLTRLEWIAGEPAETIYGFYPEQDFLANWGGPPRKVDPLRAIGRTTQRRGLAPAYAEQVLQSRKGTPLRLHHAAQVARFGFGRGATAALDVLRVKPLPLAELLQLGLGSAAELTQALAVLALCRHLDGPGTPLGTTGEAEKAPQPVEARKRVMTGAMSKRIPTVEEAPVSELEPEPAPQAVAELSRELTDKLLACEGASHYEVLGVDEKTDSTTIQATFLNLAKKWHPDRLPANARSLRADATKLFSRFSEAHQVLSSATQRAEYDRRRSETQGEPGGEEDVQRVLKAASAFQKAEAVAKRGDWAQVEHLAKLAQELDPSQPDYSALHAWAIAKSGQRVANNNYDDLLAILSVAVKALKNNAKVRLYRAQVLKAAGQTAEALKDYRAVVELEPNNVEAARELRLHKMRAAEQTNNPDGLLKRFFKK